MPQSLAPQTVDIVADIERIGPIVHDLLTGVTVPARDDDEPEFQALLEQVRLRSGIDFGGYKPATLQRVGATSEIERMVRLVSDLSDLTRFQSGKFSLQRVPLRLDTLLRQTVEIGQALAQAQTIVLTADEQPVVVSGDAQRLQQVVLNLLTNAISQASGSRRIDVRLRQTNGTAEIDVQDYGAGIAEDHLSDLFSRFYQVAHDTSYTGQGLGLGLYICQQIVVTHGGTITVTSVEDIGTTFTVHLPLHAA